MTVHVLDRGLPLCRHPFLMVVPRDWPEGHQWVSVVDGQANPKQVTCLTCAADLRMLEKPSDGSSA